jgi:UDP-N-acetylmuramyl tripeptide synthase
MRKALGTLLGKSVAGAVRVRGTSGGQAMPGLVVETVVPGYLSAMLRQLPEGVVIVTGTNGKTTTTKMVVELLRKAGKRVLTNPTGSNLTRGIISSVSRQASPTGKLPFDIAVFELDEAYARQFTNVVQPRWVLGLNASRDQLDRFGEVDTVAKLIATTMLAATEGIVTNADDRRLSAAVEQAAVPVRYFGVSRDLLRHFPRDDELVSVGPSHSHLEAASVPIQVELQAFQGDIAQYRIHGSICDIQLQITGQHNLQNAAAALTLASELLPEVAPPVLALWISKVRPAFGRGQLYTLKNGSELQLNLVKNPASFLQGLASYVVPDTSVMIAINDAVADSRDMSWLWDIDFTTLQANGVTMTSGSRAVDMALRLSYDEITVDAVEPDIDKALTRYCQQAGNKVVFASYTAMLKLHAILGREAGKRL